MKPDLLRLPVDKIERAAQNHGLSPNLVAAIVWTESRGNPYAQRFEPSYQWLYKPEVFAMAVGVSLDTEINTQKTSYGLMQLMGALIREMGFRSDMGRAFDSELNLEMGCSHLKALLTRYKSETDAISAYNQGSAAKKLLSREYKNQVYVGRILTAKAALDERA